MKPGIADWALLVISVLFTLAGLFLLGVGDDPKMAISTVAFFGLCTVIATVMLTSKSRANRPLEREGLSIEMTGGVPIFMDRRRLFIGGGLLAAAGGVMTWANASGPWLMLACCAVMLTAGCALVFGTALRLVGYRYLQFEPDGLWLGNRRYRWMMHWDNIASMQLGTFHSNPAVVIQLHDDLLAISTAEPSVASNHKAVARSLATNQSLHGVHVMLLPIHFGMDAGQLYEALRGYVGDPERRAELSETEQP